MSHDSERGQDKSEAMVAEGCQRSTNKGGWRMIYSWKVNLDNWCKHVAAEDVDVTDSGVIVFYVDSNVVAAFRDWSSIERLPSE